MDTAIGVTILSFVLPAAQCDLQMDSTSKGWLTAAPMLGKLIVEIAIYCYTIKKHLTNF
jgi:VNT family MFS transporter (synaptic vesicle glycoprotein 2)